MKAISLKPTEPKFYDSLGRVLQYAGNLNGARDAMERAARLAPMNPDIVGKLSSFTDKTSRPSVKIPRLPEPYQYGADADTAAAHLACARELGKIDDTLGEVGELLRSLELEPNAVEARRALALA